MNDTPRDAGPPRRIADRFAEWLLCLALPEDLHDAVLGDLAEERRCFVEPERGLWRAQWWVWRQVVESLPVLFALRIRRPDVIAKKRLAGAALIVGVGVLQAWDSDVFQSTPLIIGMVLAGIGIMATAVLLANRCAVFLGSLALASTLIVLARFTSPVPLGGDLLVVLPVLWIASMLVLRVTRRDTHAPSDPHFA